MKHQLHIISKKVNMTFMCVQGYMKACQMGEREARGAEVVCVCVCDCVCVHLHVHVCACKREQDRESYAVQIRWCDFVLFHIQGFEPCTIVEGSSTWETHYYLTRRPNIYYRDAHFFWQQEQMCGPQQSSYTSNSTASRRNWRRRPQSPCRLDSQCSGDRGED